ncbi:insulinase family protein [Flavonifractor plautii]|nr:insulinase family protein [Flavonifractor plautii]
MASGGTLRRGGPLPGAQDVRYRGRQRPPGSGGQRGFPNAFTSSALTGYYFESTEKFCDNLKILLSFVSIPWFTQESVDKEQGIIGQEIRMVEDDPDNQVFYGLMECLFDHHPIRVPIAKHPGVHLPHHRRHPLRLPQGVLHPPTWCSLWRGTWSRKRWCALPGKSCRRSRAGTLSGITAGRRMAERPRRRRSCAWRCPPHLPTGLQGRARPRRGGAPAPPAHGRAGLRGAVGQFQPLYARLYSEGLINKNFSYGFELYPGCALMAAGGESRDPRAVRDAVLAEGPASPGRVWTRACSAY